MNYEDVLIKPTTDLFIASLWSNPKNEPILRSLINSVLLDSGDVPIQYAEVKNPFNVQEFSISKPIRLDVRVKDELNRIYDVEVQTENHAGFLNRMLYYWAQIYGSQLRTGSEYSELSPVRSIIITEFPLFPQLENLHTVFELRARENTMLVLTEHLRLDFILLGNFLKGNHSGLAKLGRDLQNWMNFWAFGVEKRDEKMNALLDNPIVKEAYEEYKYFSTIPSMQHIAEQRRSFIEDFQLIAGAYRSEGRAEGIAEGIAEGTLAVAKSLKTMGLTPQQIIQATGLTAEEIEKL